MTRFVMLLYFARRAYWDTPIIGRSACQRRGGPSRLAAMRRLDAVATRPTETVQEALVAPVVKAAARPYLQRVQRGVLGRLARLLGKASADGSQATRELLADGSPKG